MRSASRRLSRVSFSPKYSSKFLWPSGIGRASRDSISRTRHDLPSIETSNEGGPIDQIPPVDFLQAVLATEQAFLDPSIERFALSPNAPRRFG
jgi:hypothetical protein